MSSQRRRTEYGAHPAVGIAHLPIPRQIAEVQAWYAKDDGQHDDTQDEFFARIFRRLATASDVRFSSEMPLGVLGSVTLPADVESTPNGTGVVVVGALSRGAADCSPRNSSPC